MEDTKLSEQDIEAAERQKIADLKLALDTRLYTQQVREQQLLTLWNEAVDLEAAYVQEAQDGLRHRLPKGWAYTRGEWREHVTAAFGAALQAVRRNPDDTDAVRHALACDFLLRADDAGAHCLGFWLDYQRELSPLRASQAPVSIDALVDFHAHLAVLQQLLGLQRGFYEAASKVYFTPDQFQAHVELVLREIAAREKRNQEHDARLQEVRAASAKRIEEESQRAEEEEAVEKCVETADTPQKPVSPLSVGLPPHTKVLGVDYRDGYAVMHLQDTRPLEEIALDMQLQEAEGAPDGDRPKDREGEVLGGLTEVFKVQLKLFDTMTAAFEKMCARLEERPSQPMYYEPLVMGEVKTGAGRNAQQVQVNCEVKGGSMPITKVMRAEKGG